LFNSLSKPHYPINRNTPALIVVTPDTLNPTHSFRLDIFGSHLDNLILNPICHSCPLKELKYEPQTATENDIEGPDSLEVIPRENKQIEAEEVVQKVFKKTSLSPQNKQKISRKIGICSGLHEDDTRHVTATMYVYSPIKLTYRLPCGISFPPKQTATATKKPLLKLIK
jgi:hypothetical protein